jgi:transposase InsO family protein
MVQMIKSGLEFMRFGKVSYLGEVRSAHHKLSIHADDGDMTILSLDEFRREVVDGSILMLVPDSKGILHPVPEGWKENETEKSKKRRSEIHRLIEHAAQCQLQGVPFKDMNASLTAYCIENRIDRPPKERTLRLWRAKGKGHESMISPRWSLCGNRFQGPTPLLLESIKEVIGLRLTLQKDRFKMSDAWIEIQSVYEAKWRKEHGEGSRPPSHSIRHLRNFMRMMPWNELMKLQLDGRTCRAITRTAVNPHTASKLFDAVEMDATVLDILICDKDGKEIGRPTLYVAIDTATGYPLGIYLTIQKPSTLAFVECLRFMLFPKDDDFDTKYGIKNRIEVFGKPILLRVDNGSEFVSAVAEALVYQIFCDTARCKPYTPQEKPHVERFNGTLRSHILTLPGATTSSVTAERRVILKDEKLYQLEELRAEIYQFIYDKYALRTNNMRSTLLRRAVAPLDSVREMLETITLPVPVSRASFERDLAFKKDSRSLGHDGISFQGWRFHSDELASLYLKHGPGKYEFRYSELDASLLLVLPPGGGEPVPAFNKLLNEVNVDFGTAGEIRKRILAESKELNRREFEFYLARHQRRQEGIKTSKNRAKHARVMEKMDAVDEHIQKTIPHRQASEPTGQHTVSTKTVESNQKSAPRGRKLGEKQ